MFKLYTGLPRSSKTLLSTFEGYKDCIAGRQVYSNYWLNYHGDNLHYFNTLDDIVKVRNSTILIDEISTIAHPRDFDNETSDVRNAFSFSGKRNNKIIANTQRPKLVPLTCRNVVDEWYHIKKLFHFPNLFILCRKIKMDTERLVQEELQIDTSIMTILNDIEFFSMYDILGRKYDKIKVEKEHLFCNKCHFPFHKDYELSLDMLGLSNGQAITFDDLNESRKCPACNSELVFKPSSIYCTQYENTPKDVEFVMQKFKKIKVDKLIKA